jgi:BirA family biotin operon repressor/biotin-[acetyl-CoA-carboxylase] ligase
VLGSVREELRPLIERLDVLLSVDSTNLYLAQLSDVAAGHMQVCLAELQHAGRGRRGRSWIAPFGGGLCISFSWRFVEAPPAFSALGLAVATAVVNALQRFGATDVGVKWPNDLLWRKRKLAGVLIEMRGESAGPAHVVIGIGINVSMPPAARAAVAAAQGLDISDLSEVLDRRTPPRNHLAGALIEEMVQMLHVFSSSGFAPFTEHWRALDVLADSKVKVTSASETVFGTARGVESDGTLLVEVDGRTRRFSSGDVSLRSSE